MELLSVLDNDERREIDLTLAEQCRVNVLWLVGCTQRRAALEIAVPSLPLREGLLAMYGSVEQVPAARFDDVREAIRLPFADASFDLVTLYGRRPSRQLLREMHRVLCSGGTALLAFENRFWRGRLGRERSGSKAGFGPLAPERSAIAAGFRDVRKFWIEPSLASPRCLVPARYRSVTAFERIRAGEHGSGRLRSVAANLGLQGALYPAALMVAEA
jgi:SAM-dependent methyltransferase